MATGAETDSDKGLAENELEYYTDLLVQERAKLKQLRQQKRAAAKTTKTDSGVPEVERLLETNAELRRALQRLKRECGGVHASPWVVELQNKIAAVWAEVDEAEAEVRTLRLVHRQRRRGLREVQAGERSASVMRGRQYEQQLRLREEVKRLADELKQLEKKDIHLHERFAHLQEQLMMNVTEKEVAALKQKQKKQVKTIELLQQRQEEIAARRADEIDEERRAGIRERTKAKMEKEIEEIKALVAQRDEELGSLYLQLGLLGSTHA